MKAHIKNASATENVSLSTDYIDKVFAAQAGRYLGERRYDAIDRRGKAVRKIIRHFSGYGSRGVLYYWVWQAVTEEGLSHAETARMCGCSLSSIGRVLAKIKTARIGQVEKRYFKKSTVK